MFELPYSVPVGDTNLILPKYSFFQQKLEVVWEGKHDFSIRGEAEHAFPKWNQPVWVRWGLSST